MAFRRPAQLAEMEKKAGRPPNNRSGDATNYRGAPTLADVGVSKQAISPTGSGSPPCPRMCSSAPASEKNSFSGPGPRDRVGGRPLWFDPGASGSVTEGHPRIFSSPSMGSLGLSTEIFGLRLAATRRVWE